MQIDEQETMERNEERSCTQQSPYALHMRHIEAHEETLITLVVDAHTSTRHIHIGVHARTLSASK
jgi:hypothetical protein